MHSSEDHHSHDEQKTPLGRLVFYMAPIFDEPVELLCDQGILERFWDADSQVWKGILGHIEGELKRR